MILPSEAGEEKIKRIRKNIESTLDAMTKELGNKYTWEKDDYGYKISKRRFLKRSVLNIELNPIISTPEYLLGRNLTVFIFYKDGIPRELVEKYFSEIDECDIIFN
ncbi:MAG: hypothetical protein J7K87_02705 [Candidatus Aenigmarchaeota archaeon]|nr:hypothetical protein [Candidatus Aenigmarchaeota archaeon]